MKTLYIFQILWSLHMQQFFRNVLLPVVYKQSLRSKSNCTFLLQLFIEMKKKEICYMYSKWNEKYTHVAKKNQWLGQDISLLSFTHKTIYLILKGLIFVNPFDFSFIWDSDIFSLGRTGLVHLFINKWIEIWFCLPHKIHQIPDSSAVLKIEVRIQFYIL